MSLNIYNPTTQQLTEVAGLDVKDSLEKVATLPTPTADYLNQVYILVGTQEGYHVGSIYQCRYINSAYAWVEITGSVVGKADKAPNATNNHLAKLTADGNLADSGIAVGDLGTAINKDWTDLVRPNSHDLVESNAVYSAITNAISSIYTPHGDITCAELVPALLIDENIGNVYTVTDSGTTTAYFMQGAGKTINTGDSVSIIKAGENTILFNLMGNVLDLTDYQKKNLTTAIEIGGTTQTTVEGALGGLNTKETDDIKDVYEVMGQMGAKNLIPYPYYHSSRTENGITFTVNDDGSVKVSGTATADTVFRLLYQSTSFSSYVGKKIIMSGCPQGGSDNPFTYFLNFWGFNNGASLRDKGDGATGIFNPSGGYGINIQVGNGVTIDDTFYPMIRLASDLDDTYVPYAMTNKELTDEKVSYKYLGEVGVKNILPYPYNETTKTVNGVTFTDNGDGTVTIATDSGGATAHTRFYFQNINNDFDLENRRYILSDNSNDSANLYSEVALYNGTTYQNVVYRTTNAGKVTFKLTDTPIRDRLTVYIQVRSGYTNTTGITFKPMIRLAEDADPTWQPYVMTNKELTDNKVGWDSNSLVGAKNLDGTIRKSQTSNGITFTVNSDGTVTANGTSTASTNQFSDYFIAPITGQVILSGGVNVNAHIFPWDDTDNARPYADSTQTTRVSSSIDAYGTQEVSFYMIKGHKYRMIVRIYSGTTVSNVTFKPMIRLATDTDTTYVPYAQTNQELSRNSFGNFVNITSYNSASNRYVCPCDGYAYIQENSTNNDGGTIKIYSGDGTNTYMVIGIYQVATGSYPSFSTYVKKGMQLETYHMVGNAIAYFVPLV